jgi:hypothetical protein
LRKRIAALEASNAKLAIAVKELSKHNSIELEKINCYTSTSRTSRSSSSSSNNSSSSVFGLPEDQLGPEGAGEPITPMCTLCSMGCLHSTACQTAHKSVCFVTATARPWMLN